MLKIACEKAEFRKVLLGLMLEGSTTCGDRVILLFNHIEVQSQVYLKDYEEQEFAELAIKIQHYELLKIHAKRQADERRLGDEIETTLYYQIKLKDKLSLPITTAGMLYPSMSGVDDEMLAAARREINAISSLDLLAGSDLWNAHLRKENPAHFEDIEAQSNQQMEELSESLTSQEYRDQCKQIQANRDTSLKQLAKNLTEAKLHLFEEDTLEAVLIV